MNYKKISFIIISFAFLVLLSLNISAGQIPTIYKITGEVSFEPSVSYLSYSLVVNSMASELSNNCYSSKTAISNALTNGVFVGPLSSTQTGFSNKTFPLTIKIVGQNVVCGGSLD